MPYSKDDVNRECKGRTADQQKVIKYFLGGGGCLSSGMKDEEFDAKLAAIVGGTDWRQKALNKIGVDADQVKEIDPVNFKGFRTENAYAKYGKDRRWRTSVYQISWLFFSSSQVYVWQYTFSMVDDTKKEGTEEYFYRDITNFSAVSDTTEKEVPVKTSCNGQTTFRRMTVDTNDFQLVVPGGKFLCSMDQIDDTERVIQGMKAKLREKKNA